MRAMESENRDIEVIVPFSSHAICTVDQGRHGSMNKHFRHTPAKAPLADRVYMFQRWCWVLLRLTVMLHIPMTASFLIRESVLSLLHRILSCSSKICFKKVHSDFCNNTLPWKKIVWPHNKYKLITHFLFQWSNTKIFTCRHTIRYMYITV